MKNDRYALGFWRSHFGWVVAVGFMGQALAQAQVSEWLRTTGRDWPPVSGAWCWANSQQPIWLPWA